eukprot:2203948-Pyramimonas_sp.AAC.1
MGAARPAPDGTTVSDAMGRLQQVVLGAPSALAAGSPQAALESLVTHFNQLQGAWQQMQSQQTSPPPQPQ